jgi:hypothetical protein
MKSPLLPLLVSAGALVACSLTSASAAERVVLTDNFGSVTLSGARASQEAASKAALYANLGTSDIFKGSASTLMINGMWATGYTPFDPVKLTANGDMLTLTLRLRYLDEPPSTGGALRIGLYARGQDLATLFPYNKTTNPLGDSAKGYFITVNTGGPDNTNLFRDPGDQSVTNGVSVFTTATANRIIGFTGAAFGSKARIVTLVIEKTDKGLKFSGTIAGTPFVIAQADRIGPPVTQTFDTLVFGSGNLTGPYAIEQLTLSTNTAGTTK